MPKRKTQAEPGHPPFIGVWEMLHLSREDYAEYRRRRLLDPMTLEEIAERITLRQGRPLQRGDRVDLLELNLSRDDYLRLIDLIESAVHPIARAA